MLLLLVTSTHLKAKHHTTKHCLHNHTNKGATYIYKRKLVKPQTSLYYYLVSIYVWWKSNTYTAQPWLTV